MSMTTGLAQRMKAAAIRAKAATEDYVANRMSMSVCLEECEEFNNLTDGPDNVIALVEALEAAQKQIADKNLELFKQSAHIAELTLSRKNAWKQASAARNGFDEQYALREAAEKRIAELESRTVTVKLPEVRITIAESKLRNLTYQQLDAYNAGASRAVAKISQVLAAAGVAVEGE